MEYCKTSTSGPQVKFLINHAINNMIARNLISQLSQTERLLQELALQGLVKLFCGSKDYFLVLLDHKISSHIPYLMNSQEEDIRKNALLLLAEILYYSREQPQTVICSALFHKIKENLVNGRFSLIMEASHVISNFVDSAHKGQIEELIECGFVEPLCRLVECCNPFIITVSLNFESHCFNEKLKKIIITVCSQQY